MPKYCIIPVGGVNFQWYFREEDEKKDGHKWWEASEWYRKRVLVEAKTYRKRSEDLLSVIY